MASNYYHKKINYFRLYVLELEQGKYYVGFCFVLSCSMHICL